MSSIFSVSSATPESVQNLTRSLMQSFDANKDGQFSVDEFASFLNSFIKSVVGSQTAANGAGTSSSAVGTTSLLESSAASATTPATTSRLNEPLPQCPPAWNMDKWVDLSHTTIKYRAGRILAHYSPSEWVNETTREQILADLKAGGLNPTASGKDKCDFNDGYGPIDIVQAASVGGKAWQWCPVTVK